MLKRKNRSFRLSFFVLAFFVLSSACSWCLGGRKEDAADLCPCRQRWVRWAIRSFNLSPPPPSPPYLLGQKVANKLPVTTAVPLASPSRSIFCLLSPCSDFFFPSVSPSTSSLSFVLFVSFYLSPVIALWLCSLRIHLPRGRVTTCRNKKKKKAVGRLKAR